MGTNYIPPQFEADSYYCPWCNVHAHQDWFYLGLTSLPVEKSMFGKPVEGYKCAKCAHCKQYSFWYQTTMIFPTNPIAPQPTTDMPQDVAEDFNEMREVLAKSPRSSTALLRLAIQKLCKHLGQPGENINKDIGGLVKVGLPLRIQRALDTVRVIGNNAVHPGEIDLRDDQETALALFGLVNFIVEEMITRPCEIDEIYNKLPQASLEQITRRDQTF
jgi:hypothetical protein